MPAPGSFMYFLYNALIAPLGGIARVRAATTRGVDARIEWQERTARRLPAAVSGGWWIHGASVGEARLVDALATRARASHPTVRLAGSATTPTGRSVLARSGALSVAFFAPLDVPGWPGRVLDALRPAGLALVETELWPNWIREARSRGLPVVVANGRLSPERMATYRRFGWLYRAVLEQISAVGAQSPADAARFVDLGAPQARVEVTGNLKYDLPAPTTAATAIRRRFGIAEQRTVVVAGSTGEGEERAVLEAFGVLRSSRLDAFLVLAPRHPRRAAEVESEVVSQGLRVHRLTTHRDADAAQADVLLVDTIGELGALYGLTRAAFVGGSLVEVGGHNVLEPAAAGAVVLFGPYTAHTADAADALLEAGAAIRVRDGADLGAQWTRLVTDSVEAERRAAAGLAVLANHCGATDRTVDLLARTFGVRS